jgi:peptide/nickel transport system substrate-binding protein
LWRSALLLCACVGLAAVRPHYGGTLRVEVRESFETADPPQSGHGMAELNGAFAITRWEAGRRAVYADDENASGGRPFLDTVDVQMGRPFREQAIDLELGKADLVELGPNELRRNSRRTWSSSPVRLLALILGPRIEDPRVRQAVALTVDRAAIHNVLLQRQGEISGALLPQWISGYAFAFPAGADVAGARALAASAPAARRTLTIAADDPVWQPIAARIAVNARDAGLMLSTAPGGPAADIRLVEVRIGSADPAHALAGVAAAGGLPEPPRADSPEALFNAERALLDGFHVVPLFHLPYVYGVGPRVKGGPGISPLGEWQFGGVWLEGGKP